MFTRLTTTTWSTNVVFVVLVGLLVLAPAAVIQAEDVDTLDPTSPAQNPIGNNEIFPREDLSIFSGADLLPPQFQQEVTGTDAAGNTVTAQTAGGAGNGAAAGASGSNNSATTEVFADSPLKKFLYLFVVNFFGWLVWAGGHLLDFAVNNFVINFGLEFNTSGVGEAVNDLWSLVRDFFNILFIFGFIWIGFQMILDSGNSRAKQTLVSLIMAALLVNFSLFISKFVVDFSNRLASEVALAGFPIMTEDGAPIADASQVSIANTFFAHLGISETLQVPSNIQNGDAEPWAFIFGSAIYYLIAAFVFAAGGVMLIIRFVALSIFMVLSPFMFLGWVFPGMQGWTSKYWKGFLGRAFYAPVYVVLLFFAGTILQNMFGEGGSSRVEAGEGGLLSAVTNNSDNLVEVLGPFVLSAAFMLAAVIVAGKMSADGAGGVMSVGSNIVRRGQRGLKNGALGVGRFGARNTAGYAAYGTSKASDSVANSRAYRRLNAGLGNSAIGRNVAAGMDATLAAGGRASIAGSRTASEQKKVVRDRQNSINNTQQQLGNSDTVNEQIDIARANSDIDDATQRTARQDAMNAIYNQVRRMSDEEVLNLDQELLESPEFAQHLTDGHMKALRESGIYTNDEARGISQARDTGTFDTITETLDSTNASAEELNTALDQLAQTVQRMPIDRLQGLDVDTILTNERVASNLTQKQLEDLQNSGRLTASQMTNVRNARTAGMQTLATGRPGTISSGRAGSLINTANNQRGGVLETRRERLFQGSAQSAGQLPVEIYQQSDMAQYITPSALQQRMRNGVTESELGLIESTLRDYLASSESSPREITMWQNWQNGNSSEAARLDIFENRS